MEDVTEETRYILEQFILERATEDGIDMGLVKPIINIDLAARKIIFEDDSIIAMLDSSSTISTNSTNRSSITNYWR